MDEMALDKAVSPFRVRGIVAECKRLFNSVSSVHAAELYVVMGIAHQRLRAFDDAAKAFENARRLQYPDKAGLAVNLSAALLGCGKYLEAIDELTEVTDEVEGTQRVTAFGNLAEALSMLGMSEEADEALREAIKAANGNDPGHMFQLAVQAAELGAEADALRFFLKMLALKGCGTSTGIASLENMAPEERRLVDEHPKLARTLDTAVAGLRLPSPPDVDPEAIDPEADDEAERVYRDTASWRQRANQAVLDSPT